MQYSSKQISLNGFWQLRSEPVSCEPSEFQKVRQYQKGWITTPVPGDIRQGLIAAGLISEPLTGLNSVESTWIEDRSWWLKTTFNADRSLIDSDLVEVELNGLDCKASIFLNDQHIGEHPSAFRPFIKRINNYIVEGENTLLVRLTHGLEEMPETRLDSLGGLIPTEALNGRPERGDRRRVFVRKPQFTWGWDWSPRVATVAIFGDCRIRAINKICIRDIQVMPVLDGTNAQLKITTAVEWLEKFKAGSANLSIEIRDEDGNFVLSPSHEIFLQTGMNFCDLDATVKDAKLWWPSGMGSQHRYTITATVQSSTGYADSYSFKYGIRQVQLETRDTFGLSINGKRVFCKGANWVPPDAMYARVSNEKLDKLVAEAKNANFNMLRIWGGGLYEREAFYEACDKYGIMLWHDFMFACSPYPDDIESFNDEVRKEAHFQAKRLRKYASMVLWCGNNECIFTQLPGSDKETLRSSIIMGKILPEIVRLNCPEIPYWYSSPYGAGDNWNHHDSDQIGDCHFWGSGTMHKDPSRRFCTDVYDESKSMFITEYGFIGPCSPKTTMEYLGGISLNSSSDVWKHHSNTSERGMNALADGIKKYYREKTPLDPCEYLSLGSLVQGHMYSYSLESFRSRPTCHGALFWMYDDAWGEIGWSIIDYYLRRKPSWYFVKRALAHKKLILRSRGNDIVCTIANDSQENVNALVEYGCVSLDGKTRNIKSCRFSAPALSRTDVLSFEIGKASASRNIWFARVLDNNDISPAIFRLIDFKELDYSVPNLHYSIAASGDDTYNITVSTDTYAHAVQINLPDGAVAHDNFFDLLPNQKYTVSVFSSQPLSKENVTVEPYSLAAKSSKLKISLKLPIESTAIKITPDPKCSGVL